MTDGMACERQNCHKVYETMKNISYTVTTENIREPWHTGIMKV